MSTGIETWNQNLLDIGPMYPFAGLEMFWALLGIATWIIWHLVQLKMDNKIYDAEEKHYEDGDSLQQAMNLSNAETLLESAKAHGSNYKR